MKKKSINKKSTPEELINEGLGNKEKFKNTVYRKIKGELKDSNIESISKAENEDVSEINARYFCRQLPMRQIQSGKLVWKP